MNMRRKRLVLKASKLLKYNYSDNYVESHLWAGRDSETSIKMISECVEIAKRYNSLYK